MILVRGTGVWGGIKVVLTMSRDPIEPTSRWLEPWTAEPKELLAALRAEIPCDAVAAGVLRISAPQADELLLAHGWPEPEVISWCQVGFQGDRLLRAALRQGLAVGEPQHHESESPLLRQGHALALTLTESFSHERCWWLLLTRKAAAFTPLEQQWAGLILRHWQMRFAAPQEPGLRRLLVGHDQRLILADLNTQAVLLRQPALLTDLLAGFPAVVHQRYPNLPDRTQRDLAVTLDGRPWWACFQHNRTVDGDKMAHWYLELRPLENADIPPLGLLKDDRISQAVAYIHENFANAPSLSDVARKVHISPFHFHRLFTRQVGISPKQYVQKKQLQVAKWLLRKGGTPIGQIAQNTGFSSHGHFTSTFHRVVGLSPTDYRDQP